MKQRSYNPEEIVYTKAQLMFLIFHLRELEAGCWPGIENDIVMPSGDIIRGNQGTFKSRILYVWNPDALKVAREVNTRLQMCGRDGAIVKMRFADHLSVQEVCDITKLERRTVFYCTHHCLKYMEGGYRPKSPYRPWQECKVRVSAAS